LLFDRGLFIIDDRGILRQVTMNDLPVSLSLVFWCPSVLIVFVRWAALWTRPSAWCKPSRYASKQ